MRGDFPSVLLSGLHARRLLLGTFIFCHLCRLWFQGELLTVVELRAEGVSLKAGPGVLLEGLLLLT